MIAELFIDAWKKQFTSPGLYIVLHALNQADPGTGVDLHWDMSVVYWDGNRESTRDGGLAWYDYSHRCMKRIATERPADWTPWKDIDWDEVKLRDEERRVDPDPNDPIFDPMPEEI